MKNTIGLIRYGVSLIIIIFCIFAIYSTILSSSFIQEEDSFGAIASTIEDQFFDFRYINQKEGRKKSEDITLVAIDDLSLEKIGRWPWTRTEWVKVVDKLREFGVKVIAFDIIFSEPENVCNGVSPDDDLAIAFQNFNATGSSIVLPYTLAGYGDPIMSEPPPELFDLILSGEVQAENVPPNKLNATTFIIEKLRVDGNGYGFINSSGDRDGVYRHFLLFANVELEEDPLYFPSLALSTYMKYTNKEAPYNITPDGAVSMNIDGKKLYLDALGKARVKFLGDKKYFNEVSILELLEANSNDPEIREKLEGKIAFIALTAIGNANDIRPTPAGPQTEGVLMHMNLTHSLIKGDFFQEPVESFLYSLILLILGVVTILGFQFIGSPIVDAVIVLVVSTSVYLLDLYYFIPRSYEIKLFFCLVSYLMTYIWNTFLNFYLASSEKKQIRGAFSQMVAPSIVNELLKNPEKLKLGGEKKDITVFFSDVRDFTTISEKLTPEQLSYALNIYMTRMTNILIEHDGTLDKYIGDAIVGYWGAPVETDDHAYKAILSSKLQLEALPEVNEQLRSENLPEFKVGIGLNSGICSVGNMGSDEIFQYTALGDNMNLGARLEGLCKPYRSKLLISEFTYGKLNEERKSEFLIRRMDKVRVKGKENAVEILEVLDNTHELYEHPEVIKDFNEAFAFYLDQKFQNAIDLLKDYSERFQDWSIQNLIEKCQYYIQNPPESDWDGVITFTTK